MPSSKQRARMNTPIGQASQIRFARRVCGALKQTDWRVAEGGSVWDIDRRVEGGFGSQRAGSLRIAIGGICADRRRRLCCGSQKADQLRIVECGPAADRICCGTQKTDLMWIAEGRSQKADQWRIAECRPVAVRRRRISCALRNADWLWGAEGGSAADHITDRRRRICLGSQKTGLLRIAEARPVTDRRRRASCGSQKADLLRFFYRGIWLCRATISLAYAFSKPNTGYE